MYRAGNSLLNTCEVNHSAFRVGTSKNSLWGVRLAPLGVPHFGRERALQSKCRREGRERRLQPPYTKDRKELFDALTQNLAAMMLLARCGSVSSGGRRSRPASAAESPGGHLHTDSPYALRPEKIPVALMRHAHDHGHREFPDEPVDGPFPAGMDAI